MVPFCFFIRIDIDPSKAQIDVALIICWSVHVLVVVVFILFVPPFSLCASALVEPS